jgi:CheY-like chemotaxis protein
MLLKKGYRVTSATSGEEAVRLFQAEDFHMVLTDIMLPGISGLNMLKLAKEMKPEVDVVIISSNASSFTAIKALRLGAYDYIVKPIDDEAILYNVVARTMEKQALSVENQRLIRDLSEKNHALEETLQMMRTLNSACAALASTTDIGTILRRLVENAVAQLKAEKGYLLLLDRSGERFSMKVCVGIDHNLAKTFSMPSDQGISGLAAASNKPLSIESDIPASLTVRLLEEDTCGELFSTPGILSVPLQIKDRVVGVVNISGRQGGKMFTDTEVNFITTLATYAAIALDNAGTCYRLRKNGV